MTPEQESIIAHFADTLWDHFSAEVKQKIQLRLIDRFCRHVMTQSEADLEVALGTALDKRVKELMETDEVKSMLDYCAKKKVTDRVTKRLADCGINVDALTDDQRAWLTQLKYSDAAKQEGDKTT